MKLDLLKNVFSSRDGAVRMDTAVVTRNLQSTYKFLQNIFKNVTKNPFFTMQKTRFTKYFI